MFIRRSAVNNILEEIRGLKYDMKKAEERIWILKNQNYRLRKYLGLKEVEHPEKITLEKIEPTISNESRP